MPSYSIKHIGINNPDEPAAQGLTDLLCHLFGLERTRETPTAIFAGTIFEVMKSHKPATRGVNGHIGLQTDDVEEAMADLAAKGITFQEDTIRRDENGKVNFVYLEQQFGGFAIHLTT